METMNLFEMFGIPMEENNKKNEKVEKKGKATEKKKKKISLPLNVYVGAYGLLKITENDCGKTEIEEDEIKSFVATKIKGFPADCTIIKKSGNDIGVVMADSGSVKGSVRVSDDAIFVFGDTEIDISILEKKDGTLEITDLVKLFRESFPYLGSESVCCSIQSTKDNKILTLTVAGKQVEELPEPEEKILIYFQSGDLIEISKEMYNDTLSKKQGDSDENDNAILELSDLSVFFPPTIPCNEAMIHLMETGIKDIYFINQNVVSAKKATDTAEVYNIDGKTISLLFRDFVVTAADFDGRSSVGEKDIVKFLVNKGHKEFGYTGVIIQELTKLNTILVSVKGSKKGADGFPMGMEEFVNSLQYSDSKSTYMMESTQVSYLVKKHPCFICACPEKHNDKAKAYFKWTAPMIPAYIWQEGYALSKLIYDEYGTEVLMDLYFSPVYQTYTWNVPQQCVERASVSAKLEPYLQSESVCGLIKVGQFHSHGVYPAFFSSTDTSDERMCGVYGVWGQFGSNVSSSDIENEFVLRCVLEAGYYIRLSQNAIFDPRIDEKMRIDVSQSCEGWLDRISTAGGMGKAACYDSCIVKVRKNDHKALFIESEAIAGFYRLCKHIHVFDVVDINGEPRLICKAAQNDKYLGSFLFTSKIDVSVEDEIGAILFVEKLTILDFIME